MKVESLKFKVESLESDLFEEQIRLVFDVISQNTAFFHRCGTRQIRAFIHLIESGFV